LTEARIQNLKLKQLFRILFTLLQLILSVIGKNNYTCKIKK